MTQNSLAKTRCVVCFWSEHAVNQMYTNRGQRANAAQSKAVCDPK